MPRTFFDLNSLANIVAKLGNSVGEHVKFHMIANNVGQFGHTFTLQCTEQYFRYSGFRNFRANFNKAFIIFNGTSIFKLPRNCSGKGCSNVVLPNQVALFVHDGE